MRNALCVVSSLVLTALLPAQGPVLGNGFPAAYVENSPGMLGGNLVVGYGSPQTPFSLAVVSVSGGFTPFLYPFPELLGPVAIDPFHPAYQIFFFGLDAQGHGSVTVPLGPGFALPGDPPLFVDTVTFDAVAQWSVSKTSRIDWMVPDSWEAAGALTTARQLHTATALGSGPRDNRTEVLLCGGAVGSFVIPVAMASAELFSPLTRTAVPLPDMSLPRSLHRAVRLQDGRVLIAGGVTTGGVVTPTCEFFDPATSTFALGPTMNAPRSGHAMTLLQDGRVLVSGGVADWQNAAVNFIAALNTSQDSAEIFDPVLGTWTPLPVMASKRLGHSQTLLADGRVLVVSGIRGGYTGAQPLGTGGQIPMYTTSCELFDPTTGQFSATGALSHTIVIPPFGTTQTFNGRAFHGASQLPDGRVLITAGFVAAIAGGSTNDETVNTAYTDLWDPVTGTWSAGVQLPVTMSFHGHEPHGAGVIVAGGFSGGLSTLATTGNAYFTDGAAVTPLAPIGSGRGAHSMTRLHDGTLLVYGGGVWPNTVGDGWIYAPQ